MRNPTRGKPRKAKKREEADEANFDDQVGISSRGENSRIDESGSGATPVDVSARDNPQRESP